MKLVKWETVKDGREENLTQAKTCLSVLYSTVTPHANVDINMLKL